MRTKETSLILLTWQSRLLGLVWACLGFSWFHVCISGWWPSDQHFQHFIYNPLRSLDYFFQNPKRWGNKACNSSIYSVSVLGGRHWFSDSLCLLYWQLQNAQWSITIIKMINFCKIQPIFLLFLMNFTFSWQFDTNHCIPSAVILAC